MRITDYKSGLCEIEGAQTYKLYLVARQNYSLFYDSLPALAQNWLTSQAFTENPGHFICLPNTKGNIHSALAIIGNIPIWDIAPCAQGLPIGNWRPDYSFAEKIPSSQIQLGWGLAQYKFAPHKPDSHDHKKARLLLTDDLHDSACEAQILGTHIVREMINQPANKMTPEGIELAAREIAENFSAKITVIKGKKLESHAPALHVVGRAAEVGPRLIDISWGDTGPAITLVGKGISFDSGGLDIKPAKGMENMKKDMGGAAHVLGIAAALMASETKIRLRVLVAAAENAISERAMRPLDVIDTAAGILVEIGNTDAEGRLVLADALYHALNDTDHGTPEAVIDFATLTGAARVALGTECPALFCNKRETAEKICALGAKLHDPLWQLPLFEPYDQQLDAGQGGLSSTGNSGYGGAITAALFLRRFVGRKVNWAHIDVMAWNLSSKPGRPKGGEAMGLRTIFAYIREMADKHNK